MQIGDENVHRVRAVMDEVFGEPNAVSTIIVQKTSGARADVIDNVVDIILWYAKDLEEIKSRPAFSGKGFDSFIPANGIVKLTKNG